MMANLKLVIPDALNAIRNPGVIAPSFAPGFRVHRVAMPRNDGAW
jgi:hypothetical protein